MVECKGCGLGIDDTMLFCPYCGKKREKTEPLAEKPGPLRVIPCRVGVDEKWSPAAVILSSDRICIFHLPGKAVRTTPLTAFLPPSGYLPSARDAARVEEGGRRPDVEICVDDIGRADLSYVQAEGEELYSLRFHVEGRVVGLRIPMDKTYRDLLMRMLGPKLRW